jgi:excisionase family DNA binding protein
VIHEPTLTIKEVAAVLRCSRQHVYDLTKRRELPCFRVGKNLIRIPEESVYEYLRHSHTPRGRTGPYFHKAGTPPRKST